MREVRTIALEAPLADHWIKVQPEQKMRTWMALDTAWRAALTSPDKDSINAAFNAFGPFIVEHNLVDVETGEPMTLAFEEMTPAQVTGVMSAILKAMPTQGGSADPLAPKPKPGRSPRRSSSTRPSLSTSPSSS